ncbi:MAG TPA: hypothetical protein VMV94_14540 [Phycisphaerae bacterium]|nr:hypothetical protein [Phycisphaerae bacterium]
MPEKSARTVVIIVRTRNRAPPQSLETLLYHVALAGELEALELKYPGQFKVALYEVGESVTPPEPGGDMNRRANR